MNLNTSKNKFDDFLSEVKLHTAQQKKRYFFLSVGAAAFIFLLCVVTFLWFQNRNLERITNQNEKYIQDNAVQNANQIENEMLLTQKVLENYSRQYSELLEIESDATAEERINFLSSRLIFSEVTFVYPDGTDINPENTVNVGDRSYFQDAMAGNSGWGMVRESRYSGVPAVVFYSPVTLDGEIIGVMLGFYTQEKMNGFLSYQLFNFKPEVSMLRGDGIVVSSTNQGSVNKNLLEELAGKEYAGENDYAALERSIADSSRTTDTFRYRDEKGKIAVGVIVQFQNSDWMLVSILPNETTEAMVSAANSAGVHMLAVIIAAFVVMVALLFAFLRKSGSRYEGEMLRAAGTLRAFVEHEQRQQSIIQSFSDIYPSAYCVNLTDKTYERLKEDDREVMAAPDRGLWENVAGLYVDRSVSEDYKGALEKFLDMASAKQQLMQDGIVSMEYQRADKGWRRANLIAIYTEGDEKRIGSFLFAVQKIDSEKKKELDARQALLEAYDAAKIANRAKSIFLSNMSHDIRTPMNAIIGMTAIAAANVDKPEKVTDCLKKITSAGKHLLGLINSVLDMSKIETGKIDLSEEEFCLSDMMETLVKLNQPQAQAKNQNLDIVIEDVAHEMVVADSVRLQQVLTNILSNSIKYTPDGGNIKITMSEKDADKPTVGMYEVVIEDNGIGMSEEFLAQMFEPFSRAADERIHGIQGTGLGMPIARNIIRMMDGDITVESEIDKGTRFTVSFVLKLQTERIIDYTRFVNLPILVVDDDKTACESTCVMLNELKMDSEWVLTGYEAVEKVEKRHADKNDYYAVIVDWKMPVMDGLAVTREIRKQVGDGVPIIIISAYDWSDIEGEARAAGANAFMSKPLFRSKLIDTFHSLTEGETAKETEPAKTSVSCDFTGKRVLLVEDNEINREIAIEILQMSKFEVESAQNGKEGVELFEKSPAGYYDCILMDIRMPVMNGYDAARTIRGLAHPDAATIPIIAMTANAFAEDIRASMEAGMNEHLSKPVDVQRLCEVLQKYMIPVQKA